MQGRAQFEEVQGKAAPSREGRARARGSHQHCLPLRSRPTHSSFIPSRPSYLTCAAPSLLPVPVPAAVMRGAKKIDLKKIADSGCASAAQQGHTVEHVLVHANKDAQSQAETPMVEGRDVFWQEALPQQPDAAGGWVAGQALRSRSCVACWPPQWWQIACFQLCCHL